MSYEQNAWTITDTKDAVVKRLIESQTVRIGEEILSNSKQSIFNSGYWYNKLLEISTRNKSLKTELFRFVDVLPVLKTMAQKKTHLYEYLGASLSQMPWFVRVLRFLLKVPGFGQLALWISDSQVRKMSNRFIVGDSIEAGLSVIQKRRDDNITFTADLLGETVSSAEVAEDYLQRYSVLIEQLAKKANQWKPNPSVDSSAIGDIPRVNVSIKVSALDCRLDPMSYESSMHRLIQRLLPLLVKAKELGVFINLDMEQYSLKEFTKDLFRRILFHPLLKDYRFLGVVVQAYLKDSIQDIKEWIQVAQRRSVPFSIRLVKGAYWDYEVIVAEQNGWDPPVFLKKIDTDANYEACTRLMLEAFPAIELALASHNIRSIAHAISYAQWLKLPENAFEIQMLYGMADPFKKTLVKRKIRLREYMPIGELIPGLAYLVRRLLENSSNDSFLKQSLVERTQIAALLKDPAQDTSV